jgi:hypothetical protein
MEEILRTLSRMDPQQAVSHMSGLLKTLLPMLGEGARYNFLAHLIGEPGSDKLASLVHL